MLRCAFRVAVGAAVGVGAVGAVGGGAGCEPFESVSAGPGGAGGGDGGGDDAGGRDGGGTGSAFCEEARRIHPVAACLDFEQDSDGPLWRTTTTAGASQNVEPAPLTNSRALHVRTGGIGSGGGGGGGADGGGLDGGGGPPGRREATRTFPLDVAVLPRLAKAHFEAKVFLVVNTTNFTRVATVAGTDQTPFGPRPVTFGVAANGHSLISDDGSGANIVRNAAGSWHTVTVDLARADPSSGDVSVVVKVDSTTMRDSRVKLTELTTAELLVGVATDDPTGQADVWIDDVLFYRDGSE